MGRGDFVFTYGHIKGTVMSYLQLVLYKHLDGIVGVSRTVASHYRSKKLSNVYTIENGIHVPSYSAKDYGSLSKPIGIYVSNVDGRKNVKALLDTFYRIKERSADNGTLIIIGDNPNNEKFFDTLRNKYSSSTIRFTGRVDNVFDYLHNADYFISASKNEGLPMAAIEAMSENLYLILSDIPQHRELTKVNNQNIAYFKNKYEMKKAILYFINHRNELDNQTNYKTFCKYFDSKIMFQKYLKLYRTITGIK